MSTDPKSLAAEIEAVLRDQIVLRWMGPDSFIEGHEEAARQIAARIAALQSRAFEDGERSMRQRAEDVARAWMMPEPSAAARIMASANLIARVQARNETVAGIAAGITALQPEGERNA